MGKEITRPVGKRSLTLEAEVKDFALTFRQELATGHLTDGRKKYEIEVSAVVNGSAIVVQVSQEKTKKNPDPGWRTYAFGVEDLIRAVFSDYRELVKTEPVKRGDA